MLFRSCAPASGTTFSIGSTRVDCTATDAAGNSASGSFSVNVRGAAAQLDVLRAFVASLHLPGTSFEDQLGAACGSLAAFANHAQAQAGKQLTAAQAAQMVTDAGRIATVLGCGPKPGI